MTSQPTPLRDRLANEALALLVAEIQTAPRSRGSLLSLIAYVANLADGTRGFASLELAELCDEAERLSARTSGAILKFCDTFADGAAK